MTTPHHGDPVAWRVYAEDGSETVHLLYEQARAAADEWNWSVEPLYRQPQPALTDEERKAITEASDFYVGTRTGVTLRGLLERLGGAR